MLFFRKPKVEAMSKSDIAAEIAAQHFWYHDIELADGAWTQGPFKHSVPATRALLERVEIKGQRVLDIGAMEGFFSIIACRREAKSVLATDRLNLTPKIDLIRRSLNVHFDYALMPGLSGISDAIKGQWNEKPDLIIYSGVKLRSFMPENGLIIIETIATISDKPELALNADFKTYGPGNYYFPTTGWLGWILPFAGLSPIDCRYFTFNDNNGNKFCRIAICCMAISVPVLSSPPPDYVPPHKRWYLNDAKIDFGEYASISEFSSQSRSSINYKSTPTFSGLSSSELMANNNLLADPENSRLALFDIN